MRRPLCNCTCARVCASAGLLDRASESSMCDYLTDHPIIEIAPVTFSITIIYYSVDTNRFRLAIESVTKVN